MTYAIGIRFLFYLYILLLPFNLPSIPFAGASITINIIICSALVVLSVLYERMRRSEQVLLWNDVDKLVATFLIINGFALAFGWVLEANDFAEMLFITRVFVTFIFSVASYFLVKYFHSRGLISTGGIFRLTVISIVVLVAAIGFLLLINIGHIDVGKLAGGSLRAELFWRPFSHDNILWQTLLIPGTNPKAAICAVGLGILLPVFFFRRHGRRDWWHLLILCVICIAIFVFMSRAVWFVSLILVMFMLLSKRADARKRIALVVIGLVIASALLVSGIGERVVVSRMNRLTHSLMVTGGRYDFLESSIGHLLESYEIFTGMGFNRAEHNFDYQYRQGFNPHNVLVWTTMNVGFFGFLLHLFFYIKFMWNGLCIMRSSDEKAVLGFQVLLVGIVFFVVAFTIQYAKMAQLYSLFWILFAVSEVELQKTLANASEIQSGYVSRINA